MSHELSVSPDGLNSASAELYEHARLVTAAERRPARSNKPSSAGAANVAAAIETFASAYANRIAGHGRAAHMAAAGYTSVDRDAGSKISTVSV